MIKHEKKLVHRHVEYHLFTCIVVGGIGGSQSSPKIFVVVDTTNRGTLHYQIIIFSTANLLKHLTVEIHIYSRIFGRKLTLSMYLVRPEYSFTT